MDYKTLVLQLEIKSEGFNLTPFPPDCVLKLGAVMCLVLTRSLKTRGTERGSERGRRTRWAPLAGELLALKLQCGACMQMSSRLCTAGWTNEHTSCGLMSSPPPSHPPTCTGNPSYQNVSGNQTGIFFFLIATVTLET